MLLDPAVPLGLSRASRPLVARSPKKPTTFKKADPVHLGGVSNSFYPRRKRFYTKVFVRLPGRVPRTCFTTPEGDGSLSIILGARSEGPGRVRTPYRASSDSIRLPHHRSVGPPASSPRVTEVCTHPYSVILGRLGSKQSLRPGSRALIRRLVQPLDPGISRRFWFETIWVYSVDSLLCSLVSQRVVVMR
jgi:hypothetical protein